jgi:hypothetical protein
MLKTTALGARSLPSWRGGDTLVGWLPGIWTQSGIFARYKRASTDRHFGEAAVPGGGGGECECGSCPDFKSIPCHSPYSWRKSRKNLRVVERRPAASPPFCMRPRLVYWSWSPSLALQAKTIPRSMIFLKYFKTAIWNWPVICVIFFSWRFACDWLSEPVHNLLP